MRAHAGGALGAGRPPRERRWATAAHLAAPAVATVVAAGAGQPALWALLAAPLGPATVVLLARGRDAFARHHAAEALRFNLSVAVYGAAVGLGLFATARFQAAVMLFPVLLLALFLVVVNWSVFSVIAAARAARGRDFDYPFTIRGRR